MHLVSAVAVFLTATGAPLRRRPAPLLCFTIMVTAPAHAPAPLPLPLLPLPSAAPDDKCTATSTRDRPLPRPQLATEPLPACSHSTTSTCVASTRRSVVSWRGSTSPLAFCYGCGAQCKWRRRPHQNTMHVSSVHFKYFTYFRGMLQVFHMDVTKVDYDLVYVAIDVHACCKCLSLKFHLFFFSICMLQVGLSGCCVCFTHMLQAFYLDIVYVCNDFQVFLGIFASVSKKCFKCFIWFETHVASVVLRYF
jgi:hypothetical protein